MTHQSDEDAVFYESEGVLVPCKVLYRGAHFSQIRYSFGGFQHTIYAENEDIIFEEDWEE